MSGADAEQQAMVLAAVEKVDGDIEVDVAAQLAGCLSDAQAVFAGGDGGVEESVEQLLGDALVALSVGEHG